MREMKDSGVEWIGLIPTDWNVGRIKYNYYLKGRIGWQGLKADEFIDEGPYLVTGTDFENGKVNWNTCYHISQERYDEAPEIHVNVGDLLITKDGTVGKVAYIDDKPEQVSLNSHLLIMRPLNEKYNNRFLFWVIQSPVFDKYFGLSQNGTIMASLSQEKINDFSFSLPSGKVQKQIVDYLDSKCAKIDSIIEKQQAIIEKLKEYKLSVVTETVTKGLNPDVEMKDSGVEWIGEIPKSWTVAKLKNYCELKTGSTPSTSEMEWFDGDIKWYTPGDFSENYYLGQSSRTLSQKAKDDNVATIIPKNTVMIVGIGATAGKIGFTKEECSCNQQITALKTKKMDASYLMYWMIANTKFLRETAMFTTLPILNNQTIGNYIVVAPSDIKEEQEIAEFLDIKSEQIESKIRNTYSIINKLLAYKKSLIYEVVTGKKEV